MTRRDRLWNEKIRETVKVGPVGKKNSGEHRVGEKKKISNKIYSNSSTQANLKSRLLHIFGQKVTQS